jgi:hypothetical protein
MASIIRNEHERLTWLDMTRLGTLLLSAIKNWPLWLLFALTDKATGYTRGP